MLSTPLICCFERRGDGLLESLRVGARDRWPAPEFRAERSSGNCAIGRLSIATKPTITMRMAITMATMGRLMKNFDMLVLLRGNRG